MSRGARWEKLRELMERYDLGALLLRRPANFAWYTNGADNRVDHADPLGVAAILLTTETEYVLADNIEAPRMREEETPDLEVLEHPWYGNATGEIREATDGATLGTDHPLEGATDVSQSVAPLRYVLDEEAIERYRRVGQDTARAVSEAINSLPHYTNNEAQMAAVLSEACRRRRLSTPLLMAASGERMMRYRHPILRSRPTDLGRIAMVVVCAERGGLYANLTRIVPFEEPDERVVRRQRACERILRRMREATVPERKLSDVLEDCKKFYAEEGFPDEWRRHHQGGLTGYGSREVIATPETDLEIKPGMVFAWNPSIAGAKAEETFILTGSGPEVITGSWGDKGFANLD